jgi:hypothetical protein
VDQLTIDDLRRVNGQSCGSMVRTKLTVIIGKRTPAAIAHSELRTRIAISVLEAKEKIELLLFPLVGRPCNCRSKIFLTSSFTCAMVSMDTAVQYGNDCGS